jgi:FixJ family two-component response regulator
VTDAKDNAVLVVIGDDTQRQLVGWIVAEMNLSARLVASWRTALVATSGAPSCIIADLDDVSDTAAGIAVLRKSWGGTVPIVVLSRHPDVADQAPRLGAVAGLRKPLNVGALMSAVQRLVSQTD